MARHPTDLSSLTSPTTTTSKLTASQSSSNPSYQTSPSPNPPPTTTTATTTSPFHFPPSHSFPPLYTLQPNPTTRHAQFQKWSRIILSYCAHHRLFTLSIPGCLSLPLFKNTVLKRRLDEGSVREVLGWMSGGGGGTNKETVDEGGGRVEWIHEPGGGGGGGGGAGGGGKRGGGGGLADKFYVFWKRPEEWADSIYGWVEATGQKGRVLTVWEMLEGEAARGEEFWEMDGDIFSRALGVLVKRGKAQVFGSGGDEGRGVKFF